MKRIILTLAAIGALAIGMATPVSATPTRSYTCTGGDLTTGTFTHVHSGTYTNLVIAGACDVDAGATIHVRKNLTVEPGAVFDAQSLPSTITVGRNVTVGDGALLGLGCQPDYAHGTGHECASANDPDDSGDVPTDVDYPCTPETGNPYACDASDITVHGNITATGANTILLNGIVVCGNVTLVGGGGDIPWSIKNNTIGRNLTALSITADWFGALFNDVGRNMTLTNITATDPEDDLPPVFVVRNTIGRNLGCSGLGPALSFGFYPGEANIVGRHATGQCSDPVST